MIFFILYLYYTAIADDSSLKPSSNNSSSRSHGPLFLMVCFVGIFVSYFVYGLLQEKMQVFCWGGIIGDTLPYFALTLCSTKRKFGEEYFRFFIFMVLVQCIINAAFAQVGKLYLYVVAYQLNTLHLVAVCIIRKWEASLQPYNLFSTLAFTYVGAMVASNSALSYISYPTQVSL